MMTALSVFTNGCVARSALGSEEDVLPKKLSSSTAASPVCASVLPTRPNLYGLTPSSASILRPFLRAERAYSNSSISGFFNSVRSRLPLSQRSKFANSSFGERNGCVSPSPLICVASYSGSQRTRFSAYSRSIRLPLNDSMIGNIRPLLRLPLCASARISAPVFSSTIAIHFHRSRGLGLPSGGRVVYGSTRLAFVPLSRQITLRWRLLPPAFEVHS